MTTQKSVITDEMRRLIGVESPPMVFEVDKSGIRRWADAIGDPNPLYWDEEYAKKSRYRGMVCPPGYLGWPTVPQRREPDTIGPFTRRVNGGTEIEFFQPIKAGETLTVTSKIVDIRERQGGPTTGLMLFVNRETTFRNKRGKVVAKFRGTLISYEGPTGK